jgi:pyridoxamine 5'-phosphate oxidase
VSVPPPALHPGDPIVLFEAAFESAKKREPFEANAMSLATVDEKGRPSVRVVLLKGVDAAGFVFFTNYQSRKGLELDGQREAALAFHWPKGEEQVRVEGAITRVSAEESDAYYATRPRLSQLGAWGSDQSRPGTTAELGARIAELEARYPGEVPRPPHWGGYRLTPRAIEFWYGRPNRLHERHRYEREANEPWSHASLFP